MSELRGIIEQAYEMAKSGEWDCLLSQWSASNVLARRCSRYINPGSMWSFLHQAAYFGNRQACLALIRVGASPDARTHDARTPADIAEQRGHHELAALIRDASPGTDSLWPPPVDPDVLPGSNRWDEAMEGKAHDELFVAYARGVVRIPGGDRYFKDSFGRVLIGWHGTYDPPCGMDGESMLPWQD